MRRLTIASTAALVSLTAWLSGFLPEGIPWVVASVAIAGCAAYLFKQRPSAPFCSDVALVMVVTLSPISWAGYTLLLLPIFLRRVWCPPLTLSAALLVFPANLLWEWSSTHPHDIFGPRMLYPLAVLFLAVDLFRHGPE